MTDEYTNEPMLDMYIFETTQSIEQLEQTILNCEELDYYTQDAINDIFRIMHTIKGSSAMMLFDDLATLAHSIEDVFYFLREEKPSNITYLELSDLLLSGVDFIKNEIEKIKKGDRVDGDATKLTDNIKKLLTKLKQDNNYTQKRATQDTYSENKKYYISQSREKVTRYTNVFKATVFFEDGCEMENIRAYAIIHNLKDITNEVYHIPEDIIDYDSSVATIRQEGFKIYLKTSQTYDEVYETFMRSVFIKELELIQLENDEEIKQIFNSNDINTYIENADAKENTYKEMHYSSNHNNIISVNVDKLDKLMDLVGEMVIAEAMVVENPDLKELELDNFHKAARQLNKITSEIQDMVMSIRMVPLSSTFLKMNRIVRDMCKKLGKEAHLQIIGEETEVDKNIIEHISDPLMHLVRNALDHGIESTEERVSKGKPKNGTITLEAKNAGSDVVVMIRDDGKGLNRDKILAKAREHGLLQKPENDMTDKEVFNLIFLPGFSTKADISEFSGRGVGMDIVIKNIEKVGGSVSIDSVQGKGTTITVKIPLTLAIIDGMNLRVGNSRYTLPTISIRESFRPNSKDVIRDPDGNQMIFVRGNCYPILRLHELYKVQTSITNITEGIVIMVEQDGKAICIFVDELLGQQQVVVKILPEYIQRFKKVRGISGCTLLGDGSISLILDVVELINLH